MIHNYLLIKRYERYTALINPSGRSIVFSDISESSQAGDILVGILVDPNIRNYYETLIYEPGSIYEPGRYAQCVIRFHDNPNSKPLSHKVCFKEILNILLEGEKK